MLERWSVLPLIHTVVKPSIAELLGKSDKVLGGGGGVTVTKRGSDIPNGNRRLALVNGPTLAPSDRSADISLSLLEH